MVLGASDGDLGEARGSFTGDVNRPGAPNAAATPLMDVMVAKGVMRARLLVRDTKEPLPQTANLSDSSDNFISALTRTP